MKSMNVKRIAATALGAAMVGAAFAGAVSVDPGLSNFKFFTGSEPNVKIVVGSAAQPADAVAAANIAAMIGNLAYTSEDITVLGKDQVSCGGGTSSDRTTTLEVTTPGVNPNVAYQMKTYIAGYLDKDPIDDRADGMTVAPSSILDGNGASSGRKITNYEAPALVFKTTVTDTQVSKSYTEEERYFAYAKSLYDSNSKSVKAKSAQIAYEAQFTNPIQVCTEFTPDDSTCSDTYRTSKHRVKIKFLGSDWVIYGMDNFPSNGGVTAGSTALTIGKEVAYKEFMQIGDEATAPNGIKIVLKDISGFPTGTQYQPPVSFDIYDANGNKIDTATLQEGGTNEYNKYGVVVIVWKAFAGIGQTAYAQVSIFSDKLVLTHGNVVDTNNQLWRVNMVGGGTSYGASLSRLQLRREVIDDMSAGDFVTFIQKPQAMKLTYTGLEEQTKDTLSISSSKKNFPTSDGDHTHDNLSHIRITSSLTNPFNFGTTATNTLYYITGAGAFQGLVMYQDASTGLYKEFVGSSATASNSGNVTYGTGSTVSGTNLVGVKMVAASNCIANVTSGTLSFSGLTLTAQYTLGPGVISTSGITLSNFNSATNMTGSFNASCTDVNLEFTNANGTITGTNPSYYIISNYVPYNYGPNTVYLKFYAPHIQTGSVTLPQGVIAIPEFQNDDDTNLGATIFAVGKGNSDTPTFGPDTGTAYLYYNSTFDPTIDASMNGTAYETGYITNRGSKATVSLSSASVDYATRVVHALYTLSGAAVAGAGNVAEVGPLKEGDTGLDEAGYKVVVKTVACGGAGGDVSGLDNLKPSSDRAYVVNALDTSRSPLVVLDTAAAATQPLIVVGGPMVNLVAQQTPGGDVAATPGSEAVVKVIGDKILVYGYTAADTTSAANALISWLAQNAATIQR